MSLRNKDDMHKAYLMQIGRNFTADEKTDAAGVKKFEHALYAILLLAGAETVRLMFRKNYRLTRMSILSWVLSILCFSLLAYLSFGEYSSKSSNADSQSYYVAGIFFIMLNFVLLFKGIGCLTEKKPFGQNGKSFFSFLSKDGLSDNTINLLIEPSVFLAVGVTLCFYNPLAGGSLVTCAISVWVEIILEAFHLGGIVQQQFNNVTSERDNYSDQGAQ